jgi:NAD(P)-dependent dehydrogenase (short-subunit alcohol dehydrogenase family)
VSATESAATESAATASAAAIAAATAPARIDLSGRVALVTGASRGIGLSIAASLSAAGAAVMLSSRKQDALDQVAAGLTGPVATFAANAGDPEAAAACVAATVERLGGLDILVNNAATNPHYGRLIDIDLPRYDKTMQVNLRGPLVWTQAAWRAAMAEQGGCVINISSIGGLRHQGGIGGYNVSKAGLIHMTRILASELGPTVRVNAIAPGLVDTDFARILVQTHGEALADRLPARRIGQPVDIGGAALWLASDLASWVTGQVIGVDGGEFAI